MKRFGQGYNRDRDTSEITNQGFNDAKYNWETFGSKDLILQFESDPDTNDWGYDIELTCSKPRDFKDQCPLGSRILKKYEQGHFQVFHLGFFLNLVPA